MLRLLLLALPFCCLAALPESLSMLPEDWQLPPQMEIVSSHRLPGGRGIRLKAGEQQGTLTCPVRLKPGKVRLRTEAAADEQGKKLLKRSDYDIHLYAMVSLGDLQERRLSLVMANTPDRTRADIAKTELKDQASMLKITLTPGIVLGRLSISPFPTVPVPAAVQQYQPKIRPPATHPRILLTRASLPAFKANLSDPLNARLWAAVKRQAAQKPVLRPQNGFKYDVPQIWAAKALVSLVENDPALGREALELADNFMANVIYGNCNITRDGGFNIFCAALVYDYCHDLATPEQLARLRRSMKSVAEDMEIGWPPFRQHILVGHGNEHQISRDLFAMALAVYDEDPVPYQYCSYRLFEELAPAHSRMYKAERHPQGNSYGSMRHGCDLFAMLMAERSLGIRLFSSPVEEVAKRWIYMRVPDGSMLKDGDEYLAVSHLNLYWGMPDTYFFAAMLFKDPLYRAEADLQNLARKMRKMPFFYLLINDPAVKPDLKREKLPAAKFFPEPHPGIVFRTGWNMKPDSGDAVVSLFGAGLHSRNHQHQDAGSFQFYYKGHLATDLGIYRIHGIPYDMMVNKHAVSHNVMLFRDPAKPDDAGGQDIERLYPTGPDDYAKLRTGRTLAHAAEPDYGYLACDLTASYPAGKLKSYIRSMAVLKTGDPACPVVLTVRDRAVMGKAGMEPYFLLQTLTKPAVSGDRLTALTLNGKGKMVMDMLLPEAKDRQVSMASGPDVCTVFGKTYEPRLKNQPENRGTRTMLRFTGSSLELLALQTFQVCDAAVRPVPAVFSLIALQTGTVAAAGTRTVFAMDGKALSVPIRLKVEKGEKLLITDLLPGTYSVSGLGTKTVAPENGTLYFTAASSGTVLIDRVK